MRPDGRPSANLQTDEVCRVLTAAVAGLDLPSGLAVGVDVVDIQEFAHNQAIGGRSWLERLFTADEIEHSENRADELGARFAAKEAVAKLLGTGFRAGVGPGTIEIRTEVTGKPTVVLRDAAVDAAGSLGIESVAISMTREGDCAAAIAVASAVASQASQTKTKEDTHVSS